MLHHSFRQFYCLWQLFFWGDRYFGCLKPIYWYIHILSKTTGLALVPMKCASDFNSIIFNFTIENNENISLGTREIALKGMPQNLPNRESTLVQVMAWCCKATSHYLDQCWLRKKKKKEKRNAAHYWARVDLPTPDQSPPWPQCDGLTVWVTLCFQPYSTFFNPMYPMGLSRGPQTLSHRSLIPW